MKTLKLILIFLIGINYTSFAQDIIYKKDGSKLTAKVMEVAENTIKYKRLGNLDGPLYNIKKELVTKIIYSAGYVDYFDEATRQADEKAVAEKVKREKEAKRKADEAEKIRKEKQAIIRAEREAKERKERAAKRKAAAEAQRLEDEANKKAAEEKELERLRELTAPKKHTAYGEILGLGGFISINYQPRIYTSRNGAISFSGRIGVGMSNKSIHVPHGFILGLGSQQHQFEIGVMGLFIGRMSTTDVFNFLYGGGRESRYTVSPHIGYRVYFSGGFTFGVHILMIYSEDAYQLVYTPDAEPGITPWFGLNFGYAF